jgi:hypothetical protein
VFRDHRFFTASQDCIVWKDQTTCASAIRLVSFDFPSLQVHIDRTFGKHAADDLPGEPITWYLFPGVTVTGAGDAVLVYNRTDGGKNATIWPEARYSVYFHDEPDIRPSHVLMHATTKSVATPKSPATTEWSADTAGIAVDPDDEQVVWMVHTFDGTNANNDPELRLAVGRFVAVKTNIK